MTKLVTSVAILQLVERGVVALDSEDVLSQYCPELVSLPILTSIENGRPVLVKCTKPLTLRHLLTHTSGLAYDFTSPLLAEYIKITDRPAYLTLERYTLPLIFEPGSKWTYSTGIDWAGILVERASGLRLSEYFQTHIFGRLGLSESDIGFFPTEEVVSNLQQPCARTSSGLRHVDAPGCLDLTKMQTAQLSGGGGLYGKPSAYLAFLRGVLASATPGDNILSPASFKELFTDSLPPRGSNGNTVHKTLVGPGMGYVDPEHAANNAQYLGHSIGLLLNSKDSVHGRKAGSGCWSGLARTYYWLDPGTGVAVSLLNESADTRVFAVRKSSRRALIPLWKCIIASSGCCMIISSRAEMLFRVQVSEVSQ